MEKLNITEILKNCPKGTKLYSPICGECELETLSTNYNHIVVKHVGKDNLIHFITFNSDGTYCDTGDCLLFPSKDNRDWNKFCPFKNGDVLVGKAGKPFIYNYIDGENVFTYCGIDSLGSFWEASNNWTSVKSLRFAAEEEKQQLFNAIKSNGYKWNAETKTLEKLIEPKFKVGDRIVKRNSINNSLIVSSVSSEYYGLILHKGSDSIGVLLISEQDDWELVPNKFDISTLKPFDKVLVRYGSLSEWDTGIFSRTVKSNNKLYFIVNTQYWEQCIPYEGNEHLLDTTNDCDEYYKNW